MKPKKATLMINYQTNFSIAWCWLFHTNCDEEKQQNEQER